MTGDTSDKLHGDQASVAEYAKRTAERIESRARRARKTYLRIGLLIFGVIYISAAYGVLRYFQADRYRVGPTPSVQLDWTMNTRVAALLQAQEMRPDAPDPTQEQRAAASRLKIGETLDQWDRVKKIEAIDHLEASPLSQWLPLALQGLIVFGLVAFLGFAIQIGLMFMRYYARLAELYDTQVDALNLSRGDIALATQFMDRFSPNSIDIGRSPKTVHEAILEGIARATTKEKT